MAQIIFNNYLNLKFCFSQVRESMLKKGLEHPNRDGSMHLFRLQTAFEKQN